MKLILECTFLALFLIAPGCSSITSEIQRTPTSDPQLQTEKTMQTYLKYLLIKEAGLNKISDQDCKAYAQRNSIFCQTAECKSVLNDQASSCKDNLLCKAIVNNRYDLCPDSVCRALLDNLSEKCSPEDKNCRSIIDQETAACTTPDCKAMIEKSGTLCKSKQCKAILFENSNFCK